MKVFKPDHNRVLELAGVPDPVHRPVEIDQSQTGFTSLSTLRIYKFVDGSVIDGHAEEDEVLILVLAGSIHLTLSDGELEETSPQFTLSAVDGRQGDASIAYLPPGGAYRLAPQGDAEVAYARAPLDKGDAATVFTARGRTDDRGNILFFEEVTYPQRLRMRIIQRSADHDGVAVELPALAEDHCEVLVHARTIPAQGAVSVTAKDAEPVALDSWDTVLIMPGERLTFATAPASSATFLVLLA